MKRLLVLSLVLFAVVAAPVLAEDRTPPAYLFQVVLVEGSHGGASELGRMPANVRAALEDIRGFLPYDAYRVVDTAVIRSNRTGEAQMSGPAGQPMIVEFTFHTSGEPRQLVFDGFRMQMRKLVPRDEVTSGQNGTEIRHVPPAVEWREVLSTTFTVAPEETIVVGSSKLNGSDRALIALFTALP